jgi:hypothetical protein
MTVKALTRAREHRRNASACRASPARGWVRWVTWTAILAPLPYSLSRLVWAFGIPLGIDEELLRDFDSPGIGSLYILALALLPEATALFAHTFLLTRVSRVPLRVPVAGGRPMPPALVVGPLLAPIAILAGFNLWSLQPILDGFVIPASNAGLPGWSFWGQVASFWVWGVALTVATAAYCGALRDRGRRTPVAA